MRNEELRSAASGTHKPIKRRSEGVFFALTCVFETPSVFLRLLPQKSTSLGEGGYALYKVSVGIVGANCVRPLFRAVEDARPTISRRGWIEIVGARFPRPRDGKPVPYNAHQSRIEL